MLEDLEDFRFAKELRHVDQDVLVERVQLTAINPEPFHVAIEAALVQHEASHDATPDGCFTVCTEVHTTCRTQKTEYQVEALVVALLDGRCDILLVSSGAEVGMPPHTCELARDPLRGQHKIHAT
ncbi:hypothetical protein [Piscinibacter sp. XHJ-5]|uniref:hypothetical protein n=1 Tax=Piscinibacter sp. XHJ-5 TaxID=3037797 RepID=UPI0024529475|nr:hypothetical protein [Piscinibacter sp. XHJ-5]